MLPFKFLLVGILLSVAQGQRARSSRASNLQKSDEHQRASRSSYYDDNQYGYNMPASIVLKDDPYIESRFSFPRFPRFNLPLEPSHHEYRYKRSDVEAKVRRARSFFVSRDDSVFTKRSDVPESTFQKRTSRQLRTQPVVAATPVRTPTQIQRVARTTQVQPKPERPATVVAPAQRVARNVIQKRSDSEAKHAQSAHVPTYVPKEKKRSTEFYAVPDANYDGAPGYETFQNPSYRSDYETPTYEEEPQYEEPAYKKPAYKKLTYKEPSYKKQEYGEPAYTPAYEEPAYKKPEYKEPAYPKSTYGAPKPTYSAPKQKYGAPSYPKPSYNEPAYPKPSYSEPDYPKPSYSEPSYPKPSYSAPAYPTQSYSEPAYPTPSYGEPAYPKPAYSEPAYKEPAYPSYAAPSYDESYKPKYPSYEPPTYDDEVSYGAQTGYNGAFNWHADYPVTNPEKKAYY